MKPKPNPKNVFLFFITYTALLYFPIRGNAQQLDWSVRLGKDGFDNAFTTFADKTHVFIAGYFSGTNVDFDPSAATALFSSKGNLDGFVAKYTPGGDFVWGITIGGTDRDNIGSVCTDNAGNVYITGYFRGQNIDFDPSPATFLLSSYGDAGADPGFGGDIFVAKYDKNGAFVWAFHLGGTEIYDNGNVISCDANGNLYVGAYFRGEGVDFDPGAGEFLLNSSLGTAVVAKFNTNGGFQWAVNFGGGNVDNAVFDLKVDATGAVYAAGNFQGTNCDFDPSPTSERLLSSNGEYDAYVVKYKSNGAYDFAFSAGGPGFDVARGIALDKNGNIFITGESTGVSDFDPGPGVTDWAIAGNTDVFIHKYSPTWQYLGGRVSGSVYSDVGWRVATDDNSVYITGAFDGSYKLFPDPAEGSGSLISRGGLDIYCIKYSLDLVYQCSFSIGGSGNDVPYYIRADNEGSVYITGSFSNTMDFDPSTNTTNMTSAGAPDVFLAKYNWNNAAAFKGQLEGDTICAGEKARLKITLTQGSGIFNLVYNNGTSNVQVGNLESGKTFEVSPTVTTTYTLVSLQGITGCAASAPVDGVEAVVKVNAPPDINAGIDTGFCKANNVKLQASGASTYIWSPAVGLSNVNIRDPLASPASTTFYVVEGTSADGCKAKDTILVSLKNKPAIRVSNDTLICAGQPGFTGIQISAQGGSSYQWFPANGLNSETAPSPIANPAVTTTYHVAVTGSNGCKDTGEVKIAVAEFITVKASADASVCIGKSVNLSATGATDYVWSPASDLSSAIIANPVAAPAKTTSYIVSSPAAGACSGKDTITVTVNPLPQITIVPGDTLLCTGSKIQLVAGGGIQYSWSPVAGLSDPSIPNPLAAPSSKTSYSVEVTNAEGCKTLKSITIDVKESIKINASEDISICSGSSTVLQASGASDYLWAPARGLSNASSENPEASPAVSTTYVVSSPGAGACSVNDTVLVNVNPLPVIQVIPENPFVCAGESIQLKASGAVNYYWSPSTGLNNSTIADPIAKPIASTSYKIKGVDANGCTDSVLAKVIVGPAGKIYIPNAFTPNSDGVNDCYSIKSAIGAETFELAIFNRWGERVFHSTNPAVCWDGHYKGKLQPNGNYAYYLKVKSDCGNISEKGLITLIK